MLKHFSSFAGVDYNRAGAPLIEIVSAPCMHSAKEASAYAQTIRSILLYLGASNANMDEGELRIDVNISVRPKGSKELRPRVEIKNMNSFAFLEMAIEFETHRQIGLYTMQPHVPHLELIPPGTYRWDGETKSVILMRKKESADDYRYFPEPDLSPIRLTQEYIDQIAATLPELPQDRFRRYTADLGLTPYAAGVLIQQKELSDYFEEALKLCLSPRSLCNWITIEFAGRLKDTGKTLVSSGIVPSHIAKLVELIEKRTITGPIAKAVADEMALHPGEDPESIIAKNPDFLPVGNIDEIEPLVDQILAANPQSILDFKAGKEKAFAFLVGQVMKLSRGKASPQIVNDLLRKKLQ
jgi:aspartyl-tRNA(Asn)/glutamyl-tRNA(Gln) amidotransferase subunit B